MKKIRNTPPGEILRQEFLLPMEVTAYRLAVDVCIPQTRISGIIKGRRRITADTAIRFGCYFGNSPKFWLDLQNDYDLEAKMRKKGREFKAIKRCKFFQVPVSLSVI
ncbi:MAG: HigA family addiction module antitoxin [Bacteroidota bacterium]